MAPERIPIDFFYETRNTLPEELHNLKKALSENKEEIVTELFHYSLATGDAKYINIHRLVQEVTREKHREKQLFR